MLVWQNNLNTPELIERVIGSGLFSFDDEPHFSWRGCEHCSDGLGATVYNLQGYSSLTGVLDGMELCQHCTVVGIEDIA